MCVVARIPATALPDLISRRCLSQLCVKYGMAYQHKIRVVVLGNIFQHLRLLSVYLSPYDIAC